MENLQTYRFSNSIKVVIWFGVILTVLIIVALILQPLLIPLLVAFSLYALFEPLNAYFLRKDFSIIVSSGAVITVIIVFFVGILAILIPLLSRQLQTLSERLPVILQSLEVSGTTVFGRGEFPVNKESIVSLLRNTHSQLGEIALSHGSSLVISTITFMVLVPFITFFLLKDFRRFRSWLLDRLPNSSFELGWIIYYRVVKKLQKYIRAVLVQSFIVSFICSLGFYLLNFESYVLLGILAGVFNIIPYIGPVLAMILPALISISETPFDSVMLSMSIVVVLVAQLIDNMFIIPVIISNSVNLHPLFVIMGLVIFGSFFGLTGMVVAIPVMVTAMIIYTGLQSGINTKVIYYK